MPAFIVPVLQDGKTVQSYCINLFRDQSYIGCCSLSEDHHKLLASDCDMFAYFAEICSHLLSIRERDSERNMGLRSVFQSLLRGEDISTLEHRALSTYVANAFGLSGKPILWRSLYVFCLNETIPYEYIATKLEESFPFCYTFRTGNTIRAILLDQPNQPAENRRKSQKICESMDLLLGISRPFSELSDFPSYCNLAKDLVIDGYSADSEKRLFLFESEVTNLIVNSSLHKYSSRMLSTDALEQLSHEPLLWITLKAYLDNECNVSRTAEQLFVHRSTLTHRLEKIRQSIRLDTPDERLYVRLCIRMREAESKLKNNASLSP